MERRKESLSDIKLCRFCLTQDSSLTSLYDRSRDPIVTLPLKIMACVSIEVFPSDKMPSYICERCRTFMDICYEYKQICRRADETCLQFVQKGVPISAVSWPPSLTKIFQLSKMARPMNAVIQGGATLQVSAQDMLDNDETEEETYNVKIDTSGDVSQSGPAIITEASADNESTSASGKAAVTKGVMVRVRRRSAGLGSWACEECESSFPLHQLLEIHKAQRHRARNAQCNLCEAKFFSKYDLMTHQLRHTNETPFQCVACDAKFKRLILLKRHEKMVHSDLPRHLCTNCPVTFLSVEELQAHQKRHEGYFSRQHVCNICDRKFHTKGTLQRHQDVVHGRKHFSCEYCPHRFPTISKLTRHVRAHAGDRAYPCKYCNKSFMKSHHYTRHLRLKHEDQMREARGTAAEGEFRCEQCNEHFGTQDDLYYHSAIHATQNLICPLCQEKFENVDAVTTHIRTHVNGIEFMCEYCELVFTSKEKLDSHMSAAHDDEMSPPQQVGLDESSMEADAADADADDDDEDNGLNVTEEDGHMVVEIKKAEGYMLRKDIEVGQTVNTNSEDSEIEISYPNTAVARAESSQPPTPTKSEATSSKSPRPSPNKNSDKILILRKAEAIKRKAIEKNESDAPQKKERVDSTTNSAGSSDKSLRMLEKELQELKRTNTRNDAKPMRMGEFRKKVQPVHTSTPKHRTAEDRKAQVSAKPQAVVEKKAADRRSVTKDKDTSNKEARNTVSSTKEEKSVSSTKDDKLSASAKDDRNNKKESTIQKTSAKDSEVSTINQPNISTSQESKKAGKESNDNNKEAKNKAAHSDAASTSSNAEVASTSSKELNNAEKKNVTNKDEAEVVKNGDTSSSEDNIVRRSTRPSKIKNYASMIRDRTRLIRDEEDLMENSDDSESELKEPDSLTPSRRRSVPKRQKPAAPTPTPLAPPASAPPASAPATPATPRRRGRPRKEPTSTDTEAPPVEEESEAEKEVGKTKEPETKPAEPTTAPADSQIDATSTSPTSTDPQNPLANMIVSPTGQTLKKVPVKALPPGVTPLPLPLNARRDICKMQIGKKMVKVQKIIMTKAEVEAMAKKGLLELKDGNMLLKPGVKFPETDPAAVRSGLVSQGPIRKVSATPTRCSIDGEEQ